MKLKISILLLLFVAIVAQVKAQSNPTFEQTVSYIIQNTKGRVMYPGDLDAYSRVQGYHLKDIKIEKNGRIELMTDQKFDDNKFSIIFNIFDLVEKVDYPDGIRAYKYLVHFNGLNVSKGYGITFATDADAQKIARAFRHLKKVCTKENDLFSQIPEEEKKVKLSREETIRYINNLLYTPNYKYRRIRSSGRNSSGQYTNIEYLYYNFGSLEYNSSRNQYKITYHKKFTYISRTTGEEVESYADVKTETIRIKDYKGLKLVYDDSDVGSLGGQTLTMIGLEFFNNTGVIYPINIPISSAIESDKQNLNRLNKAFLRLKELDSDEKDPFD